MYGNSAIWEIASTYYNKIGFFFVLNFFLLKPVTLLTLFLKYM